MNMQPENLGQFEAVYRWEGPPVLEFQRGIVEDSAGNPYTTHRLEVQDGASGVVVIGLLGSRILLVLSKRPAAGEMMWELPRGFGESSDGNPTDEMSMVAGAERELREETGLRSRNSELIGRYIADSSIYPSRIGVVVCEIDETFEPSAGDGEIEDVRWIETSLISEYVKDRTIHDGHSLAALGLWKLT